jgi:hypothetical protein
MPCQAGGEVVGILPGGQQHDHRRIRVDRGEQVAALALAADEAVTARGLHRMGTPQRGAKLLRQHLAQFGFELLLHRPALHIGGFA